MLVSGAGGWQGTGCKSEVIAGRGIFWQAGRHEDRTLERKVGENMQPSK